VLEILATKQRNRRAALKFHRRLMRRYGRTRSIVPDRLRTYAAALKAIGANHLHECPGQWINNRAENSHQPLRRREQAMLRKRAAIHADFHNHFNHERHLVRGQSINNAARLPWQNAVPSRPDCPSCPFRARLRWPVVPLPAPLTDIGASTPPSRVHNSRQRRVSSPHGVAAETPRRCGVASIAVGAMQSATAVTGYAGCRQENHVHLSPAQQNLQSDGNHRPATPAGGALPALPLLQGPSDGG
jgi:hypothetical protein